jgi:hypothetical protein
VARVLLALLAERLTQMPRSATAGLPPRPSSLRLTLERLAIWFQAFLSNQTGRLEAAERELSFPRHKRAKEVMLCSVGERPGGPDHWRTWPGGVTAPFEAGSKIASACNFCEAFLGAEEPKNQRGNTFQ